MQKSVNKKPVLGKFILDSLSIGMYNHPLILYREYIQNSTDAIDELKKKSQLKDGSARIELTIDGSARKVVIKDNGSGIPANLAEPVLHDIGKSTKKLSLNRGFRGIGRLGGVGYCDKLIFITKAKGERTCSSSSWDCANLRKLINNEDKTLDAEAVIKKVVQFSHSTYEGDINDSFFMVEMYNVKSSRDQLLNVPLVKSYLSQVAPVPFNLSNFRYANEIEQYLRQNVPYYETYNIYVNGEKVLKPYSDSVNINKSVADKIKNIVFVNFIHDNNLLGVSWIADIELLGSINSANGIDGLRLRSGNILVGDKNIMAKYFRESRFNGYLIGEIHTINRGLVLNSRRDDFEDNETKEMLYSCFVKEIGLPYSRKIREKSELRSKEVAETRQTNLISEAKQINRLGHLSLIQKRNIIFELRRVANKPESTTLGIIEDLISGIEDSSHFLDVNHTNVPPKIKVMLGKAFDIIYRNCSNKQEANIIIRNIVKHVDSTFK